MTNYAAPGAHVGIQGDNIVITGGLFIDMGSPDAPAAGEDGETTAVQEGPVNFAGGGDIVGVQAGTAYGDPDES